MAKNARKNLILSFCLIILTSCVIAPTFTRENIGQVLEKMCRNEFGTKVIARLSGDTIWLYAPFKNIINKNGKFNKKDREKIRNIFLSLRRVILSINRPPKFFVFVASNIKGTGWDIYQIGFIPDIVKAQLRLISFKELQQRVASSPFPFKNPKALGDKNGHHLRLENITMGYFITTLVLQKLIRTFYAKENKKYAIVHEINGNYQYGRISLTTDISFTNHPGINIPAPFKLTKKTLIHFLKLYKEFLSGIYTIEIEDKGTGLKRIYSLKALLTDKPR